jgi:hypothetical protein
MHQWLEKVHRKKQKRQMGLKKEKVEEDKWEMKM